MRKVKLNLIIIGILTLTVACQEKNKNGTNEGTAIEKQPQVTEKAVKSILTAEEQADMTPEEIIGRLKKGNENFMNNNLTRRDHSAQRRKAMIGQFPKAIVLSCVDSRVPVEDVFDLGIGDIFVARVAGNIENKDIVGSMEFATAVAGSKVVIVMGHTACGAVKSTIDNVDARSMNMNSLADLMDEIRPAVRETKTNGEISSKNETFTNDVITNNTMRTVQNIREASPTMAMMEDEGKINIISAVYDMESGKVTFNKD
ncbi:carbonic anhydrase family protein [Aquimarina gracilis]|uniref:Carbonic anhydrase family protein n=1 Tax=Aquimarina gracilis TaxID=874422 RepID=A0ABU5ZVV4_9FLAO|nr:carbonic anhydrase family protein [Aquimarina gracilis]MEB3345991.1 carbonic anhydrase family protein [Aquimarina gracilis]